MLLLRLLLRLLLGRLLRRRCLLLSRNSRTVHAEQRQKQVAAKAGAGCPCLGR